MKTSIPLITDILSSLPPSSFSPFFLFFSIPFPFSFFSSPSFLYFPLRIHGIQIGKNRLYFLQHILQRIQLKLPSSFTTQKTGIGRKRYFFVFDLNMEIYTNISILTFCNRFYLFTFHILPQKNSHLVKITYTDDAISCFLFLCY